MQLFSLSLRKLALSIIAISSLSIPFIKSAEATPYKQVRHFCKDYESVFVAAETKNFYVSICGGHSPYHYVGVDKKTGKSIRLPLNAADYQKDYFEAVNGNYTYILTDSTEGKLLSVSRGYKELFTENIVSGW